MSDYELQNRMMKHEKTIADLVNIIPDTQLLKRLLDSGLFSTLVEDTPDENERRLGMPEFSFRTYPAKQRELRQQQFLPE